MLKEAISILKTNAPTEHFVKSMLEATDQHPYATSLRVLLARSAHLNEDPRFEDFVRAAAIRTQSRQRLHQFVYEPLRTTSVDSYLKLSTTEKLPEESKNNDVLAEIEEFIEPTVTEDSIEEIPESEPKTEVPYKEAPEKFDPDHARIEILEKQFLTEVLASGAAIDLLGDDIKNDAGEVNLGQNLRAKNAIEPEDFTKTETSSPIKVSNTEPEKLSLSGWLNFLEEEQTGISQSHLEMEDHVEVPIPESDQKELIESQTSEAPKSTSDSVKEVADIISNFINNEDQIVPKRAEFFNPAKAAKSSLQDKDNLVTETLASIYAAQGNINKAISTYEKLSLLHPEKSSYFADLIKKLKQQS